MKYQNVEYQYCFNPNPKECSCSDSRLTYCSKDLPYGVVMCVDIGQWKKCKWTKKYILWKLCK